MNMREIKTRGLIFSTVYYPYASGAEIAIKEIADRLPHHEWDLITARISSDLPRVERQGSITIHRVGVGHPTLDKFLLPFTGFLKGWSLYRLKQPSLVWSMMASQASIPAAFMRMAFGRVKLVLTLQEGDEEEYLARYVGGNQFLYKTFVRPWHTLVFKRADYITALSTHLLSRAQKNNPNVPVEIIPNGVDFSVFEWGEKNISDRPLVLITTSRLVEKNDIASVVRALSLLPEHIHFWIAGTGVEESSLRALVGELKLGDRVRFLGQIDHKKIAELFKEAHIFVRPSLSEGLGSSFLEAMAAGLPIIGTSVGGIPDFLEDGKTGLFCEVKNPESIARAVTRFISDETAYNRIRLAGYELAREKYDWKTVAEAFALRAFRTDSIRPRVLIAAGIYPPDPGGPATHARFAYEEFPKAGVDTTLRAFRAVRHLPPGIRHVAYFFQVFFSAFGADAIYAYDAVSAGFPAAVASLVLNRKFIVRIGGDRLWEWAFERGYTNEPLSRFYAEGLYSRLFLFGVIRWVLRRADVLVVPSVHTANLYREKYGVKKERVVVVENPTFEKIESIPPEGAPKLIFSSRLVSYKNLSFVIRSLKTLKDEGLFFEFCILGDGPERQTLEKLVKELNLESVVRFLGAVSRDEVQRITKGSYLSLAPALTEFHPNYVLDGVSYGKPFLVSRENAFPFEVPELFLFDPRNSQEFEEKLRYLLGEEGWKEAQAELGKLNLSFTWENVLQKNISLIESLCAF